jgi:hypothetical protein
MHLNVLPYGACGMSRNRSIAVVHGFRTGDRNSSKGPSWQLVPRRFVWKKAVTMAAGRSLWTCGQGAVGGLSICPQVLD